ncbi:protein FAM169B [Hemiscyllium ocellatum]|uniref:protein FAM169B n=1 Tax=Hemiscyllium ocellatum TaxID=170820 RepID=UPI0029665D23|nr:protein FAM169B [Hemiscyllium ocellatum]
MRYPVDILTGGEWDVVKQSSEAYLSRLRERERESSGWFTLANGEKVAVRLSSLVFLQVHREHKGHCVLGLASSQTVVAVHLAGRWWSVDDAVKTSDMTRQELVQVQSVGERIVLYLLNQIIYGKWEFEPGSIPFVPHPEKQLAKIFWKDSEAVGFYTMNRKGSLCTDHTGQCYQLPVLDTVFVRQTHRRQGIGLKILQDFCSAFSDDEALGISTPISATMYKVCSKYLQTRPQEQARLWEVEAPGDWSQRVNVWLQLQLGEIPLENRTGGSASTCQSPAREGDPGSIEESITGQSPHQAVQSLQVQFYEACVPPIGAVYPKGKICSPPVCVALAQ